MLPNDVLLDSICLTLSILVETDPGHKILEIRMIGSGFTCFVTPRLPATPATKKTE